MIAYGAGNVASVQFALERLGARVRLTDEASVVAQAERLARQVLALLAVTAVVAGALPGGLPRLRPAGRPRRAAA